MDVEGGAATLFVTPTGETVMIDAGNPGARDLDRIMAVLAEAGVKEIDYLISTHYHVDHIGGMQELAKRVPIKHYIDHGPSSRSASRSPVSRLPTPSSTARPSTPSSSRATSCR